MISDYVEMLRAWSVTELNLLTEFLTSSITISAALRTDSMTSPRARHTPTCPADKPRKRPQGPVPDTGRERGNLARELGEGHLRETERRRRGL